MPSASVTRPLKVMFGSFSTVTVIEAAAFGSATDVAVIVAVPTPTPVILPPSTMATSASLVLQVTDTHLEGEWRADGPQTCRYEVYEKEHEIRGEYWGGFTRHNTLFRRVLGMDGAELGEEFITENHAIMMYNPMLEETAP